MVPSKITTFEIAPLPALKRQDMRKVIAAINTTIDGVCDHTAVLPDEQIHDHYTELLRGADAILYGRVTYQLMQYWQDLIEHPSEEQSMNDFARAIDGIPKIVFSHSMRDAGPAAIGWDSARLSDVPPEKVVKDLKAQAGRDILVGSPGLIVELANLNLIDEYQLCVHPVVAGKGLQLFARISDRIVFRLLKTKVFNSGAIILYYTRA
jgi:dihydrofolate reductase